MLALVITPASAQLQINAGEDVSVKFGFQGQFFADWTQDANTTAPQGYQQNLYFRRIRLLVGGQVAKDVTFFFETDDPNLGKTPKALGSGFLVLDAFLEWKIKNAFRLDGGIMLIPFSHQDLQSTLSYYTLDISPLSSVYNGPTQSSVLRDTGFQARGFLVNDKLQYRLGMFAGERDANSRNSLRTAGYAQYNFFGKDMGYVLIGTALGKQKLLAVDGGFDRQGSYRGLSGNIMGDIPVNGGDEIGGQVQYFHYDGRTKFPTIANQNDYLLEVDYYLHKTKAQPFGKFESQNFVADAQKKNNVNRAGFGVNYYVHGQNLKLTAQWFRALPQNSPNKASNEFTVQLQVFYF
jgi:hypothetical protein